MNEGIMKAGGWKRIPLACAASVVIARRRLGDEVRGRIGEAVIVNAEIVIKSDIAEVHMLYCTSVF